MKKIKALLFTLAILFSVNLNAANAVFYRKSVKFFDHFFL